MKKEPVRDEFIKKRMERRRKIRKRRLTAFFIIFIILLLSVGAVLSLTVFFPIQNLTVTGSKIYSNVELLEATDIKKGDNLFAVSRGRTETVLKSKLPFVDSVSLERELPNTLKITVKDAVEFACYKVDDKYYTVSSNGWVLKEGYEPTENILNVNALKVKCKVGSEMVFSDRSQKEMIDSLTTALKAKKITANLIDVTNPVSIILRADNRFEVNLGTANNLSEKISHLAGMIAEIPQEKSGKINLSMWTNDNTKGTFTAGNQ